VIPRRETIQVSHSHHDHQGVHSGAVAIAPQPFSESEIKEFQKSDRHAGGAVVFLMSVIFLLGVVLYGLIDYLIVS